MIIETKRMLLLPATERLIKSELSSSEEFKEELNAFVPNNWPPEQLKDVREYFLEKIVEEPLNTDWLYRYCVIKQNGEEKPALAGSIGFFSMPDENCAVETGYSVLPQYENKGYATEMLEGVINWSRKNGALKITAHTDSDNIASQKVLRKNGFVKSDTPEDDGRLLFILNW